MLHTKKMLPHNVGSALNCTRPIWERVPRNWRGPSSLWGVFPEYRDRIAHQYDAGAHQQCFVRSMNGKTLVADSK
jgi:cytochrome c